MKWVQDKTGRFPQRPHYLPAEIDTECERVILSFLKKKYGKVEFPVKTDDLTILIEERADLDFYADLSAEEGEVEGVTEFVPGKRPVVRISSSLSTASYMENRLRTTLTHEYGHVHFHHFMFDAPQTQSLPLFSGQEHGHTKKCKRENIIGASEKDWMEWQAGYACGAILMPSGALFDTVKRFREKYKIPYSNLLMESDVGRELIGAVSSSFQTSKDAARVRLLKRSVFAEPTRRQELF